MHFSEIIKHIRQELRITQEELAQELNVSFSTVNRWENGHRIPAKLTIRCIIDFCRNNSVDKDVISALEKL